MFYLIIFIILTVLAVLNVQFRDKLSVTILLGAAWMLLLCVPGLRYETGGDWDTYTKIFRSIPSLKLLLLYPSQIVQSPFEEGFYVLCSMVKSVSENVQWLFFIVALINTTLICRALPRYTNMPVVALLAYYGILFFNLDMIYIRQALAVSMCFYAVQYVERKSLVKYVLWVLLACLFHRVAVLMLPLYFVLDKRLPVWVYSVVIGLGCVLMLTGVPWITKIFMGVASLLGDNYAEKAEVYTTSSKFAVTRTLSIGFFINLALFVATMVFKKKLDAAKYGTIHLNMFILSLTLYYYCYELVEVSNRTRLFFLIGIIVVLPLLVECVGNKLAGLIAFVPVALYCFTFAMGIMLERPEAAAYNPYQNYIVYKYKGLPSTGKQRLEQSNRQFNKDRKR